LGRSRIGCIMSSSQLGGSSVSLFSSRMNGAVETAMPAFVALTKPRFSARKMFCTGIPASRSTAAAATCSPTAEPLSIQITRTWPGCVVRAMLAKQAAVRAPWLKVGMMMSTVALTVLRTPP
jgi:hypothetical protein